MRAVAEAMLERLQDQVSLDFGHRAADQIAGDLFGRHGRMRCDVRAARLVEPRAIRRKNAVNADFGAAREQHRAMQRVLQFAHVARPAIDIERAARLGRQRAQRPDR